MNDEQTEKFLGIVSRGRRVKNLEHEREIILKDVNEIIRSLSGVIAELKITKCSALGSAAESRTMFGERVSY